MAHATAMKKRVVILKRDVNVKKKKPVALTASVKSVRNNLSATVYPS